MKGRIIGNYSITGTIGSGGMGEVFAGEDLMLERPVAIKCLRPELASRPDVVQRFRSEAMMLAKLQHTNIATVYAFLQDGAHSFLVMEYVQGWTLQGLLESHGAFAPALAVGLCQQALDGIGFAHRQNIIHRDLKPANIMLTESGVIKVMDFGLARVLGSAHLTRTGRLLGTLEYSSPEQLRGEETDTRTDIYALGVVLYELVTGRLPFPSDSEYALVRAQVETLPPPPRELTPAISAELDHVILRALAKTPQERFQSIEAFSLALTRCVSQAEAHAALVAFLAMFPHHARRVEAGQSQPQATPQATQTATAAAQIKATRLVKAADHGVTPPRRGVIQTCTHYLVPALILTASITTLGLLFLLGAPHTPGTSSQPSQPLDVMMAPLTSPAPVEPPPAAQTATAYDQPQKMTPPPAPPEVRTAGLAWTDAWRRLPPVTISPRQESVVEEEERTVPRPPQRPTEDPPVLLLPPEAQTEPQEMSQESPPPERKRLKQARRRASASTISAKKATQGADGWYIRK